MGAKFTALKMEVDMSIGQIVLEICKVIIISQQVKAATLLEWSRSQIATNVLRLCDGGDIEAENLNLLQMFNQGTNAEFCTSTPLLQNRCYVPFNSHNL